MESNIYLLAIECGTGVVKCVICKVFIWNYDLQRAMECAIKGATPFFIKQLRDPIDDDVDPKVFIKHCVGIKGLYNLGNTCFMNSVLQPLCHIPELANYFLSYSSNHRKSNCSATHCVACEMDALFVRMFNGKKKPLCPSDMLYTIWRSSSEMAGYEQQDAHEFLICLRSSLHKALNGQQFNCGCIIHNLFAGVLQSDLTCPLCRNRTETYDPFLDISLDLVHHGDYMNSIEDCLENFTKTESIFMESYKCQHCHQNISDVHKRMSIRVAPKVLVVHLKRFEHAMARSKIDRHICYPVLLDLYRFSAGYQDEDQESIQGFDIHQDSSSMPYRLFAVIAHVGSLDSGHYTCFIRYRDSWFYLDDALVTLSSEEAVLSAPAYMLFYSSVHY